MHKNITEVRIQIEPDPNEYAPYVEKFGAIVKLTPPNAVPLGDLDTIHIAGGTRTDIRMRYVRNGYMLLIWFGKGRFRSFFDTLNYICRMTTYSLLELSCNFKKILSMRKPNKTYVKIEESGVALKNVSLHPDLSA